MSSQRVVIEGLEEAMAALDPAIAERAAVRTINDLVAQARTATNRQIRATYIITARRLNEYLKVFRMAASGAGTAKVQAKSKPLPVTYFDTTRQTQAGVSVRIRRDRPRSVIPHGFLATMKSGHVGAFRRDWWEKLPKSQWPSPREIRGGPGYYAKLPRRYRLPIRELTTVSAPGMFDQDKTYDAVQALVDEKWETVFRRNYAYYAG